MGTYHEAIWVSGGTGRTRRQRANGRYRWYLPSRLADTDLSLDPDVAQDVVRAERDLLATSTVSPNLSSTEGIARLLLRCESVASSHIEGLSIGTRRLLRAELCEQEPDNLRSGKSALAVLGNIHAMSDAIEMADGPGPVTTETICQIHKALCQRTNIERFGGIARTRQNWVGGTSYNPLAADYVPPAPSRCACRRTSLRWRRCGASLGTVRAGSALEAILGEMRGMPVFSVNSMPRLCGRSQPAVSEAVRRLLEAGIVRVTTKGKRNRVFEVPDVISVFSMFEHAWRVPHSTRPLSRLRVPCPTGRGRASRRRPGMVGGHRTDVSVASRMVGGSSHA